TDVIVDTELVGNLFAQKGPDGPASDATNDFTEQETNVLGVVGAVRTWLPGRRLLFDRVDLLVPAINRSRRGRVAVDDATGMREHMSDKHLGLASLRELRPVGR